MSEKTFAGSLSSEELYQVEASKRILDELDALWREKGYDWRFECEVEAETCWSGQLRLTPEPNREDHQPDRSYVTYASGGDSPAAILARCYSELIAEWLPVIEDEIKLEAEQRAELEKIAAEFPD